MTLSRTIFLQGIAARLGAYNVALREWWATGAGAQVRGAVFDLVLCDITNGEMDSNIYRATKEIEALNPAIPGTDCISRPQR